MSSSSRVEGSAQCRSSYSWSTGRLRASPASCSISTSKVRCFWRCGLRFGRGIALISRDAQQRPEQGRRLVQLLGALGEQRLELGEPVSGFVMGGEARRPLELRDDRVERAVGVVGRAEDG